jgi:two-component system sensor histidine kinase AtoS
VEVNAELHRRLEELEDVRSYTDSIVNSLTTGIVTVDLEGRVVTLNPTAELLTGFFRGEAAGRYCTELFAETPQLGEVLMETLASRAPITSVPVTLLRRNGEVSTAPLKGGDGKDLGAVAVFRDLTLVRQLETRLRRSDRLAALGTLAAGFAHEIKNPLTSILTFSRRLDRRFDDADFRARFQNVVPRELERINEIVERLLELARPARLQFELVRLPAIVDRVAELYADRIETHGIRVVREYARDVPPIQADEESLYRAVVNLVTNVEVEDTGPGISPDTVELIFNPFFTTKDTGTGLGLALTNKIVEDHAGTIDYRQTASGGAMFRITLPLVPEPAPDIPDGGRL